MFLINITLFTPHITKSPSRDLEQGSVVWFILIIELKRKSYGLPGHRLISPASPPRYATGKSN